MIARSWLPARQRLAARSTTSQQQVRLGAVADDVAETPDLVGHLGVHLVEDRFESVVVPVDV